MSKIIRMQSFFERIKKQLFIQKKTLQIKEKTENMTFHFYNSNAIHLFKRKFLYPIKTALLTYKRMVLYSVRIKYINTIKYFNFLRTRTFKKTVFKLKDNINKVTVSNF
jgi:hypothetical protein